MDNAQNTEEQRGEREGGRKGGREGQKVQCAAKKPSRARSVSHLTV